MQAQNHKSRLLMVWGYIPGKVKRLIAANLGLSAMCIHLSAFGFHLSTDAPRLLTARVIIGILGLFILNHRSWSSTSCTGAPASPATSRNWQNIAMEIKNTALDGGGTAFVKLGNWKHKIYQISIHTMEIATQPKWMQVTIPFCGSMANVNRSYSPFGFPVYTIHSGFQTE